MCAMNLCEFLLFVDVSNINSSAVQYVDLQTTAHINLIMRPHHTKDRYITVFYGDLLHVVLFIVAEA